MPSRRLGQEIGRLYHKAMTDPMIVSEIRANPEFSVEAKEIWHYHIRTFILSQGLRIHHGIRSWSLADDTRLAELRRNGCL